MLCEAGSEFKTLKELLRIPEIIEAKVTYGMYDIVCKIDAPSMESIKDIIINDIRGIRQVKETQTLPLFWLTFDTNCHSTVLMKCKLDSISDIGKFNVIEQLVDLNADRKRLWFETLNDVNDKTVINSIPISLNYF